MHFFRSDLTTTKFSYEMCPQALHNFFMKYGCSNMCNFSETPSICLCCFRSCASRDRLGIHDACDTTWLHRDQLRNPLALGQIVNNAVSNDEANVMYLELDIPCTFPVELLKYIPNVRFKPIEQIWESPEDSVYIRTVLLISLREIFEGEELFSSYFTEVGNEKI